MKQFFLPFIFYFLIRHKLTNIRFDMGSLLRDCPINFDNKHSYVVVNVYNHKHIKLFLLSQTRHKLQVNKCITRLPRNYFVSNPPNHSQIFWVRFVQTQWVCVYASLSLYSLHTSRTYHNIHGIFNWTENTRELLLTLTLSLWSFLYGALFSRRRRGLHWPKW